MHHPGPCVHDLRKSGTLLLSKNTTRTRPRCNAIECNAAMPHCVCWPKVTLHTAHSTLHLISSHLKSLHPTSSLLISSHLSSKFFSTIFMSADHCSTFYFHLMEALFNSSQLFCPSERFYCQYFPLFLCAVKLAQRTSQYYFALQNLHKKLYSATLQYKTCRKYFRALLCPQELAQGFFHREAFTQRSF